VVLGVAQEAMQAAANMKQRTFFIMVCFLVFANTSYKIREKAGDRQTISAK